jgi:IS5 family transposase
MRKRPVPQMNLLDGLIQSAPANDFLERLDQLVNWHPVENELANLFTAATGRLPRPPLVVFKMLLLQHCYNLSDPQCEEQVKDRLSWRKFVGLSFEEAVPDETTLVRFRQRLIEHGLHEKLLRVVNQQLEKKGLILKTCTLADATLLAAARKAPSQDNSEGGDSDADYTVKKGTPHYGYKAHVATDETHTMIRKVTLTQASVHDSREFQTIVKGDEEMVIADKAYWSRKHSQWCADKGVANGILRKPSRGEKLSKATLRVNKLLSSMRSGIERVFGWWKRSAGYRRVRYVGWARNRLELELKSICWNLKRWTKLEPA